MSISASKMYFGLDAQVALLVPRIIHIGILDIPLGQLPSC